MPIINDSQMSTTPLISTRIKSHMNAMKFRDRRDTSADGQPRRNINQSNTLPFRNAHKKIDGTWNYQTRPDIHNVFHADRDVTTNSNRILINADNNGGCTTNIGNVPMQCSPNLDNNGLQSLENNPLKTITLRDTIDAERSATSDRDLYNPNRKKLSTCEYDQSNTVHNNANRIHLLALPPVTSRYQNHSKTAPIDLTRYSICSAESEKTDFTDLSPMTPSIPYTIRETICSPPLHCKLETQSNIYDDFTEASCSSSNTMVDVDHYPGQCYYDQADQKRYITNMFENHLPQAPSIMNQYISTIPTNEEPIWNKLESSHAYGKNERRRAYQRPKYSLVNTKNATRHQNIQSIVDISDKNSQSNRSSCNSGSCSDNTAKTTTTATTEESTQSLNRNIGGAIRNGTNNSELGNYVAKIVLPPKTHSKVDLPNIDMDRRNTSDLYREKVRGTEWPDHDHGVE